MDLWITSKNAARERRLVLVASPLACLPLLQSHASVRLQKKSRVARRTRKRPCLPTSASCENSPSAAFALAKSAARSATLAQSSLPSQPLELHALLLVAVRALHALPNSRPKHHPWSRQEKEKTSLTTRQNMSKKKKKKKSNLFEFVNFGRKGREPTLKGRNIALHDLHVLSQTQFNLLQSVFVLLKESI
jgi:hypothetical protein